MADDKLTVEEIDEKWALAVADPFGTYPDEQIYDMARRFATEIPKLEADLTKQTIKANYLEGEFGDLLKERDQLETQLPTATAQVERMREALGRLLHALPSYRTEHSVSAWDAIEDAWRVLNDLPSTNYVEKIEDQLTQTRAYYAQRDQRMREALELLLPVAQRFEKQASRGSGGRRGGRVFTKARAALTSHPADNDASKFVEEIKGEVLRDLVSRWEANSNDSKGFETFDIRKFAAGHGIPLTSPTPEPDICMACGDVDCGGACVRGA